MTFGDENCFVRTNEDKLLLIWHFFEVQILADLIQRVLVLLGGSVPHLHYAVFVGASGGGWITTRRWSASLIPGSNSIQNLR